MTTPTAVTLPAPAKVNLGLDILRRRPDGYHDLQTLFLAVSLSDQVTVRTNTLSGGDSLEVAGAYGEGVPTHGENLVLKAVSAYRAVQPATPHVHIRLVKNIPHGAGLGGGSSDAASTLKALAQIAPGPEPEVLHALASSLGSDCAFFLGGGAALASGRGEVLSPLRVGRTLGILLIIPTFGVSTRDAYRLLRPEHLGPRTDFTELCRALADQSRGMPLLGNSFEAALAPHYPQLAQIRDELRRLGASQALLSGSGSATFGLFETVRAAHVAAAGWRPPGRAMVVTAA